MEFEGFEARKRAHIDLALDPRFEASGASGLGGLTLPHVPTPELDFEQVNLASLRLGQSVAKPFYISAMTAGHSGANEINLVLATACEKMGWALGLGSQRRELEAGSSPDHWKQLRDRHPFLPVIANLGAAQVIRASTAQVRSLVDSVSAQALAIHLNPLQEVIQPEGTAEFRGLIKRVSELLEDLGCPIVLKETGCGFSKAGIRQISVLSSAGLAAVDVSGLGGTHWGRIEGARAKEDAIRARAAETFKDWGVSTVESVQNAVSGLASTTEVWASGGVRTGLDAAKLLALGATQIGFAKPALEAALQGEQALLSWMQTIEFELQTALFCTGSKNLLALRERVGHIEDPNHA
jgi:isopentenyl-diphosphate delta-isomerase